MIRFGVNRLSNRVKTLRPESVNVNPRILFHRSSVELAIRYEHNKQTRDETSTHRLLTSQSFMQGTFSQNSAAKLYNLDDLKTNLKPQLLESEMVTFKTQNTIIKELIC